MEGSVEGPGGSWPGGNSGEVGMDGCTGGVVDMDGAAGEEVDMDGCTGGVVDMDGSAGGGGEARGGGFMESFWNRINIAFASFASVGLPSSSSRRIFSLNTRVLSGVILTALS